MNIKLIIVFILSSYIISCNNKEEKKDEVLEIPFTAQPPVIDGNDDDACWQSGEWTRIDKLWIGKVPAAKDYMGTFKTAWDSNYLYVIARIYDDSLVHLQPDGLKKYWDDDCLEIFVDEDASGGNHQYNYNAFAYHLSLDGKVVDIGPDSVAHYYPEHVQYKISQKDKVTTWELAVKLFKDDYKDSLINIPAKLFEGKKMGFSIAYNDNDKSKERENMIGSVDIDLFDKNVSWIDAGYFGKAVLVKTKK